MWSRMQGADRRARDRGATSVEYGLIAAGVGIAMITGVVVLQNSLASGFTNSLDAPGVSACATNDPACNAYSALPPAAIPTSTPTSSPSPSPSPSPTPTGPTTCATRTLGPVAFTRNGGSGTTNVLTGVAGGVLTSATESGDGSITWVAGGAITWTYANGAKSTAVDFSYTATGCVNGIGSATFNS